MKLKMATASLSMKGVLYLEITLKKIQMVKELFVSQLETGMEVLIPKELSQDSLPYSFRYYDAIVPIVHSKLSEIKKENFSSLQNAAYRLHYSHDL